MDQRTFAQIEKICAPISKDERVKAIWAYGSSVTGKKKKDSDIDIMFLLDDTDTLSAKDVKEITAKISEAEFKSKVKNLNLHFQAPKPLTFWWGLLISGEPWVVTSVQGVKIISDPSGLLKDTQKYVKENNIVRREEKAENLINRSGDIFLGLRRMFLGTLVELTAAATESIQILLLFDKKLILDKNKIVKELEKNYISLLGDSIGDYRELVDMENKVMRGTLSEFSGKNLDYYTAKVLRLKTRVEGALSKQSKA